MSFGAEGYALVTGEGDGLWFLNTLMVVKTGGDDTRDAFTLIECQAPAGFGPPLHIHHDEDRRARRLRGYHRAVGHAFTDPASRGSRCLPSNGRSSTGWRWP